MTNKNWFLFLAFFFFTPTSVFAVDLVTTTPVSISASVGQNEVTIYGQSSPNSKIELTGINIYSVTYSQDDGSFKFDRRILPKNPSELCLTAKDSSNRSTSPICIPPPPATNYHTNIGPIILPPTVSLEQDKINPYSTVISSGKSIPNSTIHIYFYKVTDSAKSFAKTAMAYSLPVLTTTTDNQGNYNLNLPTAYASNYRLYTSVDFNGNYSPKSNTLFYSMPSQSSIYFLALTFILTLLIFFTIIFINFKNKVPLSKFLPANIRHFYPAIYPESISRNSQIPR